MLRAHQPYVAQTLRDPASRKAAGCAQRPLLWGHVPRERICSDGLARPSGWVSWRAAEPMTPRPRSAYPGETLGLPASGPGSLARMGRRLVAILIDWLIAGGLALLALRFGAIPGQWLQTTQFFVWLVLGFIAVRLFGFTPGQFAVGLQVASVDGRVPVGIVRLAVRGLLVGMVIPALFTDWDGRGLHDRVTGTAVVRR